jgi:hypothetical protein
VKENFILDQKARNLVLNHFGIIVDRADRVIV